MPAEPAAAAKPASDAAPAAAAANGAVSDAVEPTAAEQAPDPVSHEMLPSGSYGSNTPGKRKASSQVWTYCKRLKDKTAEGKELLAKGYTHICTRPLDGEEVR
eukprot:gene8695-1149_t